MAGGKDMMEDLVNKLAEQQDIAAEFYPSSEVEN